MSSNFYCYYSDYLLDVSNLQELILFVFFCLIDLAFIVKALYNIRLIRHWIISRQKRDQKLLMIMVAILLAYIFVFIGQLSQIIFYRHRTNKNKDNEDDHVIIIEVVMYYIMTYSYIYLINIVIYSTCILWLNVVWRQLQGTPKAKYVRFLQYTAGFLIFFSTVNLFMDSISYACCVKSLKNTTSWLNIIVIILAAIVQTICIVLFKKTLFKYRAISRKTKKLLTMYSVSIITCFCIRIIWDVLQIFKDTQIIISSWRWNENEEEDGNYIWFIYLIIYIPSTFYFPSILILNLYTPKGSTIAPITQNQTQESLINVPSMIMEKNIQSNVPLSTEDTDFDTNFR